MDTTYKTSASNQWLTEREVATMTNLSVSTIQKQRFKRRGIPYSKIGRSVRYLLDDVIAFMEAARVDFITL